MELPDWRHRTEPETRDVTVSNAGTATTTTISYAPEQELRCDIPFSNDTSDKMITKVSLSVFGTRAGSRGIELKRAARESHASIGQHAHCRVQLGCNCHLLRTHELRVVL